MAWLRRSSAVKPLAVTDPDEPLDTLERKAALNLFNQTVEHRSRYGSWLLSLVVVQVVAVNTFFVLIGTGVLHDSSENFKTFAISIFAEIVALPLIVARSLFPSRETVVGRFLEKLFRSET